MPSVNKYPLKLLNNDQTIQISPRGLQKNISSYVYRKLLLDFVPQHAYKFSPWDSPKQKFAQQIGKKKLGLIINSSNFNISTCADGEALLVILLEHYYVELNIQQEISSSCIHDKEKDSNGTISPPSLSLIIHLS